MKRDTKSLWGALIGAAILSAGTFVFMRQPSAPKETPVSPLTQELHKHLQNADEARIYSGAMHSSPSTAPIATLSGQQAKQFVKNLIILEEPPQTTQFPVATSCLCYGTHEFRFYKSKKLIYTLYFKESWRIMDDNTKKLWYGDKLLSKKSKQAIATLLKTKIP